MVSVLRAAPSLGRRRGLTPWRCVLCPVAQPKSVGLPRCFGSYGRGRVCLSTDPSCRDLRASHQLASPAAISCLDRGQRRGERLPGFLEITSNPVCAGPCRRCSQHLLSLQSAGENPGGETEVCTVPLKNIRNSFFPAVSAPTTSLLPCFAFMGGERRRTNGESLCAPK